MKLALLPLLILSFPVFSQIDTGDGSLGPCTQTTFVNGGTFNCASLTLSGTPALNSTHAALTIKVQGAVSITGIVNFSGGVGLNHNTVSGTANAGGLGGPGAGDGGGDDGGGLRSNGIGPIPPSGKLAPGNVNCGDGGGGGGFSTPGGNGFPCNVSGSALQPGDGGIAVTSDLFTLSGPYRGGFGGGAGGENPTLDYGAGGGGGGFIRIIAGGDITVTNTGSIIANGGAGGPGNALGGGGGGGSGGVIWLQSVGNILIDGALQAGGSLGGTSTALGNGGAGGRGLVRLEDVDGIIAGNGSLPTYVEKVSIFPPFTEDYGSSISCGMIQSKEDSQNTFFQFVLSFIWIVSLLQFTKKGLKFFT